MVEKHGIETSFDSSFITGILDNIPGSVLVMQEGKFCGCNQVGARLFKSPDRTYILGKSISSISPSKQPDGSDSAEEIEKILAKIVHGKNLRYEWRFNRADNTFFDGKVVIRQCDPEYGQFLIFSIIDNSAESGAIHDILTLSKEMKNGNLRARLSPDGYYGDLEKLIKGINLMLDDILHPFRDMSKVLIQISHGNIHARLENTEQGEHEKIRIAVNGVADAIQRLQVEINRLTDAAKEGRLAERGRPELFEGAYAETISGMNEMLNAILSPIRQGNQVLQKMRKGDLSQKVDVDCVGDHARLKDAINDLHRWLSDLITYVTRISEGDMSASIEKASDKDQIYGPLIGMRDNIRSLIKDVNELGKAGSRGDLTVRADSSHHQGDFKEIIDGMNHTLDSVIIPIQEAMKVSESYAHYNFSTRINPQLDMQGDWTEFKQALDLVGVHISTAVQLINEQVNNLNLVVTQTHSSIDDVSEGTAALANIAQSVSLNAERGKEGISQILGAMEDLAVNVSAVSARADEVNRLANNTNDLSEKGTALAKDAELGMDEITLSTDQVVVLVHEIMEEMKKISKITQVISDIASQTNLLALNAAIEAARAGESGRGFAVVASEVKSLALESRKSAENITQMIEHLQKKTELASTTMDKSAISVSQGGKALKETLRVFNEIIGAISTISQRMDEVARSAEQQAASVEEITASINEVNEMVLDTAKEALSAAAASEQASAATDQLSSQSNQVFSVANRLNQEMQKFTTG